MLDTTVALLNLSLVKPVYNGLDAVNLQSRSANRDVLDYMLIFKSILILSVPLEHLIKRFRED
jgi:hypothetical protein